MTSDTRIVTPNSMRRLLWLYLAFLAGLVSLIAFSLREQVSERAEASARSTKLLSVAVQLEKSIGYGGFIHDFKNAVLRPAERSRYIAAALSDAEEFRLFLRELEALLPSADGPIAQVEATIDEYVRNITILQASNGEDPLTLDPLVRVEDTEAIFALTELVTQAVTAQQAELARIRILTAPIIVEMAAFVLILLGGVIYYLRQMSRLETAEATAREQVLSLDLVQQLIDNITDGVLVLNAQGRLLFANDRALEVLPFLDTARTASIVEKLAQDYPELRTENALFRAFSGETVRGAIINLPHLATEATHLRVNARRFAYRDETNARLIELTDISEQVAASQHQQRVQNLSTMGHLASGIAHDFRNILGALRMNLNLLERTKLEERQGTIVKNSLKAVEGGYRMAEGLTQLSSGAPKPVSEVDLIGLVRRAVSFVQATVAQDAEIAIDLPEGPLMVRADENALLNGVVNIVLNASEAMKKEASSNLDREKRITLSVVSGASYFGYPSYAIAIEDTGPGFSEAALKRAGELFFTDKKEGTGIGLTIARGVVDDCGGQLILGNAEREGAVTGAFVKMILPRILEASDAQPTSDGPLAGRRILFVEDDPVTFDVITWGLQSLGAELTGFCSGEPAMEALQNSEFDLLLSDIDLKGSEYQGFELIAWVRENRPAMPAIAHTKASSLMGAVPQLKGVPVIAKGQDGRVLEQAVMAALSQSEGAQP